MQNHSFFPGVPNMCFSAQNIYPQGTSPWGSEPSLVLKTVENSIKSSLEARASSHCSSCLMEIRNAEMNFHFPRASGVRRLSFRVICCTEKPLLCFWDQEVTLAPRHVLICFHWVGVRVAVSLFRMLPIPWECLIPKQQSIHLLHSPVTIPELWSWPHGPAFGSPNESEQKADCVATSWLLVRPCCPFI